MSTVLLGGLYEACCRQSLWKESLIFISMELCTGLILQVKKNPISIYNWNFVFQMAWTNEYSSS